MYLAREHIKGKTHYIIRQSYPSAGQFKSRDLFNLGTDPTRFINYPGGNSYYYDPVIEEALSNKGLELDHDDLDEIFFEFLDLEIQRVITAFDRGYRNRPHHPKAIETSDNPETHIFDRRRYHYLRFGHSNQRYILNVPDKVFIPLLHKSRDELEHYFGTQEGLLKHNEIGPYVATIFKLDAFRWTPDTNQPFQSQMDAFFIEKLCCLNSDKAFMAGAPEPDGLYQHLIKYAILYFDFNPLIQSLEQQILRDFINRHRIYRPPAKTRIQIKEAEALFGHDWKTLKGMDRASFSRLFRKLALKHHPDQGGDSDTFRRLSHYYKILAEKKPNGSP